VASTVTNAHGDYSFDRLFPGTFQVGIPADQSTATQPATLNEWEPVAGSVANPEASNFDNDGAAHAGFISRTDDVVLTYNGEPTNDTADNAYADALTSPRTYADANSNLNVDFVFNQATYELGNLVWSDNGAGGNYNNGKADADESGLNGVTVELYRDNGAGGAVANDGILAASERIASTVTAGGGFYDFKNLPAGNDYHVVVVRSSVPIGYAVAGTPVTVAAADGVDNDNNAAVTTATGWSSGAISLGPLSSPEPTGEKDGTTGTSASPAASVADNRADQTVDFGFVPSMRIGNQVWRDESDNDPVTQVSTDNNGVFNPSAGEVGLSGVSVELWRDVNHNGFQASGDDVKVATTTTDANGNYWFDGVRPGDTYFVAIKTVTGGSSTLVRPTSSTGQSASVAAADNVDDGAPDAASGYLSVSRAFTPALGTASTGETDANQVGAGAAETAANARAGVNQYGDTDSELRVDFGFVNVPVYRLGNLVWKDNGGTPYVAANENNGIADPNEPGIPGVEVQLFAAADTTFTTVLATATTDINGEYAFENLVAGNYVVRIPSTGTNATTLTGLISTKDGAAANADVDNDDNGVATSGGWASSTLTLNEANVFQGGEPTTESRRSGEAGTYDTGLSWTTTTTDPAAYANNRSNLTVDFGFVATYRIGNLIWLDLNNDGIAQTGEPGIDGVTVQLVNPATGAVLASTVTAGGGKYSFTSLAPGNYAVHVVPSTLPAGVVPGGTPVADANNDTDNDNNAASPASPLTAYSATVTLGGVEPTTETLRSGVATDDDADSFADAASNYTVDFGFWPQMRLGNVVWIDQSAMAPATYTPTDNNGVLDPGETLVAGAQVDVWLDGGNGVFDAGVGGGDDTFVASDRCGRQLARHECRARHLLCRDREPSGTVQRLCVVLGSGHG
jgi:protocatechuate 3,4-dioxygenase beta subunit